MQEAITIMHAMNGQWQELYGHCCGSLEEADQYVKMLAPNGDMYVVREGQEAPACPQPAPKAPLFPDYDNWDPERQARFRDNVKQVLDALNGV